ncbi:MAG: ammonium transporter, partial [Nitrososphaera sp.]
MADGKVKTLLGKKITLLGVAAVIAALVTINFSGTAFAYAPDDPAVKYHCWLDEDGDENLDTVTDEETGEVNLVPCPIDSGDNAWMLTSSALVLMMTPAGLAIFYGGLARSKHSVNALHMTFITTGLVAIQYVLWGYSLAFGPDAGGYGFIGTLDWVGLNNVLHDVPSNAYGGITGYTIPHGTYMIFQMMFAIITPALIVASLAERMKYSAFVIFVVIWATFVYDFAAHWTWSISGPDNYGMTLDYCGFGGPGGASGFGGCNGALDFAGGTVIHITSGWSGLVIALMLGRRLGYGKVPMEPHNVSMVVLGAALLW